jgi:hypothetical protein
MKVAPSQEILTSAAGEMSSLNRWLATNLLEIAAVTDGSTGSDGVAGGAQLAAVAGPSAAEAAATGSFSVAARRRFPLKSKNEAEQRTRPTRRRIFLFSDFVQTA